MSIVLGGLILPEYKEIKESKIELSAKKTTITGKLRKDIFRIKSMWSITFEDLTQTQLQEIIDLYELKQSLAFVIDSPNKTVNTTVFMELPYDISQKWRFQNNSFTMHLEEV